MPSGELHVFPPCGLRLIVAALQSPVTRNRNFALRVLAAWPPESRSGAVREELERASGAEPNEKRASNIRRLLAGEPME